MTKVYSPPEGIDAPDFNDFFVDGRYDRELDDRLTAEFTDRLAAWCRERYTGDLVGEVVRFPYADGYAAYMIANHRPLTLIHLPLGDQVLLLLVAMLSSKGAAGITGAGFITLAATLSVVPAVPVAGMALILGIDRFMSECRAVTNFIGNAVATVVVARWEGELDENRLKAALAGQLPDFLDEPLMAPAE